MADKDDWDEQTAHHSPLIFAAVGSRVIAFDRRRGTRVWEWDGQNSYWGRMLIADDRIVVGSSPRLVCLAHDSGQVLWETSSPVGTGDTLLLDGNEIIVASAGEIAVFALANGKLLWHDPLKGYGHHAIAIGSRNVGVTQVDR